MAHRWNFKASGLDVRALKVKTETSAKHVQACSEGSAGRSDAKPRGEEGWPMAFRHIMPPGKRLWALPHKIVCAYGAASYKAATI
jgi:hypothetical protein